MWLSGHRVMPKVLESVTVIRDRLASVGSDQGSLCQDIERFLDELDGSVAEEDIRPARMEGEDFIIGPGAGFPGA